MTVWKRWVEHPQRLWLRRFLFQVHLWSGIALGLYILMISVTGSVLVYRNELFEISERALEATTWLLDLHDNLLAGARGRVVNGFGALAVLVLAVSGLVIWWPGVHAWRRSLTLPRGVSFRRAVWHLHSMVGLWTLGIILLIGLSGAYFGFPDLFPGARGRPRSAARRRRRPHQRPRAVLARLLALRPALTASGFRAMVPVSAIRRRRRRGRCSVSRRPSCS
jgi:hypothetical protein